MFVKYGYYIFSSYFVVGVLVGGMLLHSWWKLKVTKY